MKTKFLLLLAIACLCNLMTSCRDNDTAPSSIKPYLNVAVSDSIGNTYTEDSIILPNHKNKMIFDIATNCRWKASKQNISGLASWFSVPSKQVGGGDATLTSNVTENKTTKEKKVYFYVVASDSSIVRKIVIVQKAKQ